MNRLKSIFVSVFITYVLLIAGLIIWQVLNGSSNDLWLANGLGVAMILLYFAGIFLIDVPRTSKHMIWITIPILLGFIWAAYIYWGIGQGPEWLFGFSGGTLLTWLIYTYWATDFSDRDLHTLKLGQRMPNAELKDVDGQSVMLSSFFQSPAIFLFYRGNWCPFCMAQIKELAKEYQRIKAKGAELIFISPQNSRYIKSLAKKVKIPAHFLLDESLTAAKQLGVFSDSGTPFGMEVLGFTSDNVLPTLIVTDANGIIRFADLTDNYRMRPEPTTYLKLLEEIVEGRDG